MTIGWGAAPAETPFLAVLELPPYGPEPAPETPSHFSNFEESAPAGVERWRELAARYPWPVDEVLRVMACESGGDPRAVGWGNYGLLQLNEATWRPWFGEERWSLVLEPEAHLAMAYEVWTRNGWSAWACRP